MFSKKKKKDSIPFHYSQTGMYFLLAGLLVVLFAHIHHLPIWTTLTCFTLMLWRWLYDAKFVPLPNRFIIFLMVCLIVFGVISSYQTILGRNAGSAMLMTLLFLKLLEIKSLRDISIISQLALFAIVVAFLFSNSIFMAVSMTVAVVLLMAAIIGFQHAKSGNKITGSISKRYILLSSRMVILAVPLTVLVFFIFPRTSSPLWGLPQDAFQAKTGLSDNMSPGKISQLIESRAVAFRARFNTNPPPQTKTYWRGPVLWSFDGDTWSAPGLQQESVNETGLLKQAKPIDYSIIIEPHNNFWLFALDLPGQVPRWANLSRDRQLLSSKRITSLFRYELTSYLEYVLPWDQQDNPERYLQVPETSAPRARRFIKNVIEAYPTKIDRVNAILEHFRTQDFYYSRQPPLLINDPIDEFLYESKRGYCEHYASTFTVLMRLAGIPSRVITGYQGGEMNPLSNYMIVRQSDAHAWSEIYLKDKGWVRVDPTSVIPVENIENTSDAIRLRSELANSTIFSGQGWFTASATQVQFAWDLLNNNWNEWIIGYTTKKQKSFFNSLGIPDITWKGLGYFLFATLTLFILIVAINMYLTQRVKKNKIEKIYIRFLNKLRPLKIVKDPSEGVLSFSERVATRYPERKVDLLEIATLYNRLRYAKTYDSDLISFRNAVRTIRFK